MVAHAERTPEDVGITYADFHEALDHLSEMLCRYHLLITQDSVIKTTPVITGDWKGPFRQPLA